MSPTRELVIAVDVGATNVRARIAAIVGDGTTPVTGENTATQVIPDITSQADSAQSLYGFVADVVATASGHGDVVSAVVAVAGMVQDDHASVTNWPTDSLVDVAGLQGAGLPRGRTRLVNDMVAGVWGAFARVERDALGEGPALREGSVVYVAPGTGLGSAALIRHGCGPLGGTVIASEAQHTQIPRFEGEIASVVDVIAGALGRAPTWEELVSGPGLGRVYGARRVLSGGGSPALAGADAVAIAHAARRGDDSEATTAVRIYYRALAHFAQTLALSYLPCAAVVIGGASTMHNLTLLRASGLEATFAEHPRFGAMLGDIPVRMVDGVVNLEGGVWLATALRSSRAPSR